MRKSRTPGSARGAGGNSRSYRDQRCWMHPFLANTGMDRDVEQLDRLAARAKRERYRAEAIASRRRES